MANLREKREYDFVLVGLYALLAIMGIINIYAATYIEGQDLYKFSNPVIRQSVWFIVSLIIGFFITLLDIEFIRRNSYFVYGATILMLIIVLFLPARSGAHSWFGIGSFGIQPSEFAKTGTAMALAFYLTTSNVKLAHFKTKITASAIILLPGALIILQPDPGTFLVFTSFLFVLYREGLSGNWIIYLFIFVVLNITVILLAGESYYIPYTKLKLDSKYFLLTILTLIALTTHYFFNKKNHSNKVKKQLKMFVYGGLLILGGYIFSVNWVYSNILKDRHRDRIALFLGKVDIDSRDVAQGIGYNIRNSQSAIGSGGLFGKGYLQSELANEKANLVPEQNTDFIFCTLSEEWGFIGSSIVILLFCILLVKIILIAERQKSNYSRVFGYSVAFIIFSHVFINIAMVSGIAPVIGIPLAFFSYGGSSLLAFSILIFILFKLDSERMNKLS